MRSDTEMIKTRALNSLIIVMRNADKHSEIGSFFEIEHESGVAALVDRKWSDVDLAQLVRGNTLRVMRDVEAVARDLQETRRPSLRTIEELDG